MTLKPDFKGTALFDVQYL